jgi:type IV secretory pathway VirB10-like protein
MAKRKRTQKVEAGELAIDTPVKAEKKETKSPAPAEPPAEPADPPPPQPQNKAGQPIVPPDNQRTVLVQVKRDDGRVMVDCGFYIEGLNWWRVRGEHAQSHFFVRVRPEQVIQWADLPEPPPTIED